MDNIFANLFRYKTREATPAPGVPSSTMPADNGKQLWTNYGTQHYVNSIRVPAGRRVSYTINVRNPHIPGYKGHFRWKTQNVHTYFSKIAG